MRAQKMGSLCGRAQKMGSLCGPFLEKVHKLNPFYGPVLGALKLNKFAPKKRAKMRRKACRNEPLSATQGPAEIIRYRPRAILEFSLGT